MLVLSRKGTTEETKTGGREKDYIWYACRPTDLLVSVDFDEYVVRDWLHGYVLSYVPSFVFMCVWGMPRFIPIAIKYIVSISASIALLNCAPVFYGDGSLSLQLVANEFSSLRAHVNRVLLSCTVLMFVNILLTLLHMFGLFFWK